MNGKKIINVYHNRLSAKEEELAVGGDWKIVIKRQICSLDEAKNFRRSPKPDNKIVPKLQGMGFLFLHQNNDETEELIIGLRKLLGENQGVDIPELIIISTSPVKWDNLRNLSTKVKFFNHPVGDLTTFKRLNWSRAIQILEAGASSFPLEALYPDDFRMLRALAILCQGIQCLKGKAAFKPWFEVMDADELKGELVKVLNDEDYNKLRDLYEQIQIKSDEGSPVEDECGEIITMIEKIL